MAKDSGAGSSPSSPSCTDPSALEPGPTTRVRFRGWDCIIQKQRYENGRPALRLVDAEDGSPIATATVNLPEVPAAPNQVFIKDHSENGGLLAALTGAGVVKATGEVIQSGHVEVALCELLPPYREVTHGERVGRMRDGRRMR
jgi:hypothetical protein